MENEIALDIVNSKVDVLLGGGLRYFIPKSVNDKKADIFVKLKNQTHNAIQLKSYRQDDMNLLEKAEQHGYQLAFSYKDLIPIQKGKILGVFSFSEMHSGIFNTKEKQNPRGQEYNCIR